MRIGLLATVRDEVLSLPRFFRLLENIEADSRVDQLVCSFYENDSIDDTPELLAAWLRPRSGTLQSVRTGYPRLRGREIARTRHMADARNHALAALSDDRFDWLVVIDVDLYTKPTHIWQLIEVLQRDRSVVMACSSSLQNTPDIFGHGLWSYYDSYALVDKNNWLGITGALIPLRDLDDRAHWIVGRPVSVQSAFGGIAVLNMNIVRLQDLRWDGTHGCEHWSFCQKASSAGLVMACPQVNPLVLHEVPRLISLEYQQRRKRELKELWSKAIVYN